MHTKQLPNNLWCHFVIFLFYKRNAFIQFRATKKTKLDLEKLRSRWSILWSFERRRSKPRNKYGLLTKCGVMMAGYWSSFCEFTDGPRRSRLGQ